MAFSPAPGEAIFPRVIDATMRSDWLVCPHKFFRRHCQGLVPHTEALSVHLHFGACLAKGFEASRRAFVAGSSASASVLAGTPVIITAWGDYEGPPNPSRSEKAKTLSNCILAHAEYFREYPLDDDQYGTIHVHKGRPCIEFSGAVPIPGIRHPTTGEPLLYAGRFDAILDWMGRPWGDDEKTTSSLGDSWAQQWKLRGQFSGYCWIAREFGLDLEGFIVKGIGITKTAIKFQPVIAPRPRWMVDAWLKQLQDDALTMIGQFKMFETGYNKGSDLYADPFPQVFDTGCHSYNKPCAFLPLCSSPNPDAWLSDYDVSRWNPLTRTEDVAT